MNGKLKAGAAIMAVAAGVWGCSRTADNAQPVGEATFEPAGGDVSRDVADGADYPSVVDAPTLSPQPPPGIPSPRPTSEPGGSAFPPPFGSGVGDQPASDLTQSSRAVPVPAPFATPQPYPDPFGVVPSLADRPPIDDGALLRSDAAEGTAVAESVLPPVPARLPGGSEIVRVYYGTNRERSADADGQRNPDSFYTTEPGPLDFGVLEVSIPGTHKSGEIERPRWYTFEREDASRHVVLQRVVPVDEHLFLRELRADVSRDPMREAFVFIHGFNVEFPEAAWRAGQMKADLGFRDPLSCIHGLRWGYRTRSAMAGTSAGPAIAAENCCGFWRRLR